MSIWAHEEGDHDPALAPKEIDKAILTLCKKVEIVRDKRIPLLAGYSNLEHWAKTRIIYADYRLPKVLRAGGKTFDPMRYILVHECVEAALMAELGMSYSTAHSFATGAERSAVQADKIVWKLYVNAVKPYIAKARVVTSTPVPEGLDKTCYKESHETHLLKEKAA